MQQPAHSDFVTAINRCQIVVGQSCHLHVFELLSRLDALVDGMPPGLSRTELVVLTGVLGQVLARLVHAMGIDVDAGVASGFLGLASSQATLHSWRAQWFRVTQACATIASSDGEAVRRGAVDSRVIRMLQIAYIEYSDQRLTLQSVARTVHISPSHAARLIKDQTGLGFTSHLRRRRVQAARHLLLTTQWRIKEIAAAVGYSHASKLNEHFKRTCGQTPEEFRRHMNRRPA